MLRAAAAAAAEKLKKIRQYLPGQHSLSLGLQGCCAITRLSRVVRLLASKISDEHEHENVRACCYRLRPLSIPYG